MATPETLDEWIDRLNELLENSPTKAIDKAYSGNAQAKATIQAWAVEMQAAALFIAAYAEAQRLNQDMLVEVANIIIDTVQAILLALGIAYLLRKLKKRKAQKDSIAEIKISKALALKTAGDRAKAIPSSTASDKEKEALFLKLRVDWTTHFLLTLMQGLKMQTEAGPKAEWVWRSRKDAAVCSICKAMDGEKSKGGDFLPVLLKKFPDYKAFVPWMLVPHAHPRCRCKAVLVK